MRGDLIMSKFFQEELSRFKQRLIAEKEQLLEAVSRIEKTGLSEAMVDSSTELSMYDNHPADIADQLFERSKDSALVDNAKVSLGNIETALAKISEGTYGECNHCGANIGLERLEALPFANLCIECQEEADERELNSRPLEEEVIVPRFQQNFNDYDQDYFVGVGAENVLQSVLKYGSSDSPSDLPIIADDDGVPMSNDEHLDIIKE